MGGGASKVTTQDVPCDKLQPPVLEPSARLIDKQGQAKARHFHRHNREAMREQSRSERRLHVLQRVNAFHERMRQLPEHMREFPVDQLFPSGGPTTEYACSPRRADMCRELQTAMAQAEALSVAVHKAPGWPSTSTRRLLLKNRNTEVHDHVNDRQDPGWLHALGLVSSADISAAVRTDAAALAAQHRSILLERDIQRQRVAQEEAMLKDPTFQEKEGQRMGLVPSEEIQRIACHYTSIEAVRRQAHDSKAAIQAENKAGAVRARVETFGRSSVVLRLPEHERRLQVAGAQQGLQPIGTAGNQGKTLCSRKELALDS